MPEEKDDSTKGTPPRFFQIREDIFRQIIKGLDEIATPIAQFHPNDIVFLKSVIAQEVADARRLKLLIEDCHFCFEKKIPSKEIPSGGTI